MGENRIAGIVTPVLTPFNDEGSLAMDLYGAHCSWVLAQGSHYISPFGTTGEALSVSMDERMQALESLIHDAAILPDKIIPGTGLCSMPETVELTRHAVSLGCRAVLVLPPFFYVQASDEGLYRYFSNLIDNVASPELKICLYHIPSHAGIGFSPGLANRLNRAFEHTIIAIKDSSGDWENTSNLLDNAPGLSVFPGSETFLLKGLQHGGAGCVSATCNINVRQIRQLYDQYTSGDHIGIDRNNHELTEFRKIVQEFGVIPVMKSLISEMTGEHRWKNIRLPLIQIEKEQLEKLVAVLGPQLEHLRSTGIN